MPRVSGSSAVPPVASSSALVVAVAVGVAVAVVAAAHRLVGGVGASLGLRYLTRLYGSSYLVSTPYFGRRHRRRSNPSESRGQRHLDQARRTARESLTEARRIVWALRPEALEDATLSEALTRLAGRWSQGSGVTVAVSVTGAQQPLSLETEVTLLRAAQEALNNVRKHAGARRVVLTLSYMADRVALDIQDDGVGFEPGGSSALSRRGNLGGFGLRSMRERVEQSGGTLVGESEPERGTTLAVELPVRSGRREERGAEILEGQTP